MKSVPAPQNSRDWIVQTRHSLEELASRALELANSISVEGKPLDSQEKTLIRLATLPALSETLDMIKFHYIAGHDDRVNDEMVILPQLVQTKF